MSNNTFSRLEMIRIAILMEEEGYAFYKNGANYTSGKIKDFLVFAAGQEFIHKEKFTKLFNDLSKEENYNSDYLFDSETALYLKDLIENKVFNKLDQPIDIFKDLKTSIQYALKSEELAIIVYKEMYEKTPDKDAREIFADILKEEKTHAEYFSKLLKEIV